MTVAAVAAIAYGTLALLGGIIGFLSAKSTVSLVSGGLSGIALIILGVLEAEGVAWAQIAAAILTGLLVVVFIVRMIKTRKLMPAAIMIAAGVAALLATLLS